LIITLCRRRKTKDILRRIWNSYTNKSQSTAHPPLGNGIPVGQKIVAIDPQTGKVTDFVSLKVPGPNFRPVSVKFNEKEGALYIIDCGKAEIRSTLPNVTPLPMPVVWPYANGGVVWKITKTCTATPTTTTAAKTTEAPTTTGIPGVP
jgi:hypothetical protein